MPLTPEQKQNLKDSTGRLATAAQNLVDEIGQLPNCAARERAIKHIKDGLKESLCAVLEVVDITPA